MASVELRPPHPWEAPFDDHGRIRALNIRCSHAYWNGWATVELLADAPGGARGVVQFKLADLKHSLHWCDELDDLAERYRVGDA